MSASVPAGTRAGHRPKEPSRRSARAMPTCRSFGRRAPGTRPRPGRATRSAELVEDVRDVALHRVRAEIEARGRSACCCRRRRCGEHLVLARAERPVARRRARRRLAPLPAAQTRARAQRRGRGRRQHRRPALSVAHRRRRDAGPPVGGGERAQRRRAEQQRAGAVGLRAGRRPHLPTAAAASAGRPRVELSAGASRSRISLAWP